MLKLVPWSSSKPPPMPSNSASSSSSTRSSLMMLPFVLLLATDSARFLDGPYLLRQAWPIPTPEAEEWIEDREDLRATMRSSMALSRASASRITKAVWRGSRSESETWSRRRRRRPHSASSSSRESWSSESETGLSCLSYSSS